MMQFKKNRIHIKRLIYNVFSKTLSIIKILMVFWMSFYIISCESFLEIDPPKDKLINETVFTDVALAEGALANIYYKMREQGMVSGSSGLSTLMAIYADELNYIGESDDRLRLENHNVTALHLTVSAGWSNADNLIYAANDIIKGVENSTVLSIEEKERFKGHALFVRGYIHSLLVPLFGDVPYINTTNYLENNTVARTPIDIVYENCIEDIKLAINL
ncbi:MAG: RagB/SusD family nutrient uptake outer membrane protein [Cellulophaga sp.]